MIISVIAGGALGALLRFFTERWSVHRFGERIPYGTLLVNVVGSFLLGIALGMHERGAIPDEALLLFGTGFCGSLTTFSGWIGQIYTRGRHNETRDIAFAYLAVSLIAGIALAYAGYNFAV